MLYVVRDSNGQIMAASKLPLPNSEAVQLGSVALADFVGCAVSESDAKFESLDADFIRVVEDLIDVLINKNVIRMTDLPAPAQKKLSERKGVRENTSGLSGLLGGEELF